MQDDPAGRIREQEKHAMAYRIKWFGIRIDLTGMRISAQGEGKGVGLVKRLVSRSPGMPYSAHGQPIDQPLQESREHGDAGD